jgi:hypothetical protein
VDDPNLAGMFLDSRPSDPNRHLSMETQYVPWARAADKQGRLYARIAPTSFPRGERGESVVLHGVTVYNKKALWDAVKAWFAGGPPASGRIDPAASVVQAFGGKGGCSWKIEAGGEAKPGVAWDAFATPFAPQPDTFGYRWNDKLVRRNDTPGGSLATLPEYYRLEGSGEEARWVAVAPEAVPEETGLAKAGFGPPPAEPLPPYVTPDDPRSCWKKPGPVAGPFEAHPGDGSVVTYYWYRFADQPALLNADLTDAERETMQARAEKIHRHWKKDRDYLPPPRIGKLAEIDPALLVTQPRGLEIGYVPIATRQGARE